MALLTESQGYEIAIPGMHGAVCCEFVDLGEQKTDWGIKDRGVLVFQVDQLDSEGKPIEVRVYFTKTLGTAQMPSKVRKFLKSWGVVTESDLSAGVNLNNDLLRGRQAQLFITVGTNSKGREKNDVENVLPPAAGQQVVIRDYIPLAQRQTEAAQQGRMDNPQPPPMTPPPQQGAMQPPPQVGMQAPGMSAPPGQWPPPSEADIPF